MTDTNATPQSWKVLSILLWVAQLLLAAGFGLGGFMKTTQPIPELAANLVWPGVMPVALVRFIGASEFAAAVGMILPAATRIRPGLTPLAGAGLATIMVFAMIFHIVRGEMEALPINLLLGGLAGFVAWGRWKKAPIAAR